MRTVLITAFGETKRQVDWANDPRCVVPYSALSKRIKAGWAPEKAITYIPDKQNHDYLTGRKFGRLLVTGPAGTYSMRGERYWNCVCDCGNLKTILTGALMRGDRSTCGCSKYRPNLLKGKRNYLGYAVASRNRLLSSYQQSAKLRNLEWVLEKDYFFQLTKQNCYYCNTPPLKITNVNKSGEYVYNGVDRVDTSLGYTVANSVPCCEQCNIMKFDYSIEDFFLKIAQIYHHHNLNKSPTVANYA